MTTEMVVKSGDVVDWSAIEQVVAYGDLAKLTAPQRVLYYNRVCDSIGVNPATRPLEFIQLNGKTVLYTRKDCTDQLRSKRGVSISIVSKEKVDDVYVVTTRAKMPDGREDEATGAVALGNLKGEALANALMKAETKAKRRVTLSICGLGFTDESEIADIPNARVVQITPDGEIIGPNTGAAPDFATLIEGAKTEADLTAIAHQIKASGIGPDVRKPLLASWTARKQALAPSGEAA